MRKRLVLSLVFLAGCGGAPAHPGGPGAGPAAQARSGASQRAALSITVYNGNFGLVRDVRDVEVGKGTVALEIGDVAAHIQPETVHLQSLGDPGALQVLEQNYRYDLLTPQKLLEKYVGKHVKLHRYDAATATEQDFDAEVLSANEGAPVFRVNGEVTYGFPGRISFPDVPANLIAKPTLVVLAGSGASRQKLELAYMTGELDWSSDYVLSLDESDTRASLVGWVTLTNHSGASYENAQLKLVAGDVQRVRPRQEVFAAMRKAAVAKDDRQAFSEEGFFEYHLYTLQRPTTLLDNEQKQVTLLEGEGIAVEKKLVFTGTAPYYRVRYDRQLATNQKVGVFLEIANEEKNHLGIPLPKGVVRVYKADRSGAKEFIGEDHIDHTPRDERIRIKMGEAFDVVGDRKQMSWTTLGACSSESEWEVSLRNHKDVAAVVDDVEAAGGDWEIVSSSHTAVKKDAHTFVFTVTVPSRGEVKITYRVRVRWC